MSDSNAAETPKTEATPTAASPASKSAPPPKAAAPNAVVSTTASIGVDYPGAFEVLRAAHDHHVSMGALADVKASLLVLASLITLAIVGPQAVNDPKQYGIVALAVTSLLVAITALKALMPRLLTLRQRNYQPELNLLFCGHFAQLTENDYLTRLGKEFAKPSAALDALAKDVFQMGIILHQKKFRNLSHACSLCVFGLVVSAVAAVVSRFY